jgi:dihydroflavonol-4-reductase
VPSLMTFVEPERPITPQPILVTGVSGFIGLHVAKTLLERGYSVRGTLRSLKRVEALRQALTRAGQDVERIDFVRLDLMHDDGFGDAMRGVSHVIHVASPIPTRPPRDADELVVPARDGMLRVLRAAANEGVKRVVVTSSVAAIHAGHPGDGSHVFDESDFSRLDRPISAYARSKTVAEMAAWELVRALPAERKPELVTINPGFVLGPILESDPGVTNELVLKLVKRQLPGIPNLVFALVDVRDIAELHYRAMVVREAAGQRFCCALPTVHVFEIAAILRRAGYQVPSRRLPDWLLRVVALFDAKVALAASSFGNRYDFDSTRARTLLGWEPRSIETTLTDTAASLQQHGLF